jgi:hypothetical protein
VPAKLTNALYEHVEEPEASPTIPSQTAHKLNNKETMNGTTTLAVGLSPATEVFDGSAHSSA